MNPGDHQWLAEMAVGFWIGSGVIVAAALVAVFLHTVFG